VKRVAELRSSEAFSLGVTGHRSLAAGTERTIGDVLREVRRIAGPARLRVLSSLAVGADQVVARRALELGAEIWAVLPLPRREYEEDFADQAARTELERLLSLATEVVELPAAHQRPEAYVAAGRWVVDHSDLLLAVWDGGAARGSGGTAEIVAYARRRGAPLAWLRAAQHASAPIAGPPGTVSWERLEELRFHVG
jgi:hypothetical protein